MSEIPASPITCPLLTVRQLAAVLQVSTRTVWRMRSAGELPEPVQIRRRIRWRREEIDVWLMRRGAAKTSPFRSSQSVNDGV